MKSFVSMACTYTEAFLRRVFGQWLAAPAAGAPALVQGGDLRLFKADGFVPGVNSTTADMAAHECVFTDYAFKPVALVGPVNLGTEIEGVVQTVTWIMATSPAAAVDTVGGWWIEDAAGLLVCHEVLPVPVPMGAVGDAFSLTVKLPLPSRTAPEDA